MSTQGPHIHGERSDVGVGPGDPVLGLGYGRGPERPPHRHLVAAPRRRLGRIVRQAKTLRGERGDQHALIVDRDHGIERLPPGDVDDRVGGRLGPPAVNRERSLAHHAGKGLPLFGGDDHLRAEHSSRLQEVGRAIGRGGQQEEQPRHSCTLASPVHLAVTGIGGRGHEMSEHDPALDGFTITKRALDKFVEVGDDDPQPSDSCSGWP